MRKKIFTQYLLAVLCSVASTIVSAQNVFKVTTGATIKTTGGVIITLQDMNLDNDGSISQATGEGVFRFSGTQNNTIAGTNAPLFDVLEIAKTGSAKISLQRFINIGAGINFTSGLIDLNNNNIFLQPAALLNSESETSRIIGANGGYVEITNTLNAPSSANPGNLGAIISSSQNLGATIIRRGHIAQVNGFSMGSSILRYYDILPANNTALNATLRFMYLDAELNGFDENTVVLWKSANNTTWTQQGFTSRSALSNFVEKTGIADFSRWTLSSPGNALPVFFTLFNLKCDGNPTAGQAGKILLSWKTAQEQNSSHFNIERSMDGFRWSAIGSVPAAGNSSIERSYSYTDNSPASNGAIYRIAEYDIDGRTQYTSIIRADCEQKDSWSIWPNPVQEMLWVNITATGRSAVTIKIVDSKGSLVRSQQQALLTGSNQLNIDMKRLPSGTYHVTVEWGQGRTHRSVTIIKM
ncbi:MAG: T9SS type A sorting domain-containing protein [Chitinophagaceae bacterium]